MDKSIPYRSPSDALVLFGATGDLSYKKIFPSLYAMVKRGALKIPVVGVGFSGWTLAQLQERVKDSIKNAVKNIDSNVLNRLLYLFRYVDGDYENAETFQALKTPLKEPCAPPFISPYHPLSLQP